MLPQNGGGLLPRGGGQAQADATGLDGLQHRGAAVAGENKNHVGRRLLQNLQQSEDKTGGLIVDYIGLKKWLMEALSTYTKRDQGKIVDTDQVVKVLRDKIELIRNLLHGFDYSNYESLDNLGKYQMLNKAANFVLKDEDTKNKFMRYSRDVKNLYAISTGSITYEDRWESMFIISVRSFINKLTLVDGKLDVTEINRDVAQMLQQAIQDDELIQVGKIKHGRALSMLSDQMLQRLATMENKNIAAEILRKALRPVSLKRFTPSFTNL